MSIIVTVRIATTLEAVAQAEKQCPGAYERVIELAYSHGLISHRRVYRDGEIMDIDEWPNEEARAAFRAEAGPLVEQLRNARGSAPSTAETWTPLGDAH
jgi:hypothetical protein